MLPGKANNCLKCRQPFKFSERVEMLFKKVVNKWRNQYKISDYISYISVLGVGA